MRFRIVTGVREQSINRHVLCRLADDRREVRRVIAGTLAGQRGDNQVTVVMNHRRQLGIPPVSLRAAADARQEVAADVMALQPRRVDRGFGIFVDQAASLCNAENSGEEPVKSPFFRSRSCAF